MIDIFNLYRQFESKYNTHQSGFFRPVRDFVPAVHEVSLELFAFFLPNVNKSQKAKDFLQPFMRTMNVVVHKEKNYDYIKLPKDYSGYGGCRVLLQNNKSVCDTECEVFDGEDCKKAEEFKDFYPDKEVSHAEHSVENVDATRWGSVLTHRTKGPSSTNVKITQIEGGFRVEPRNVGVLVLDYYVLPKEPVLSYTEVSKDPDVDIVYDEKKSKPLEWSERLMPEILRRLGVRYGLFTKDNRPIEVSKIELS